MIEIKAGPELDRAVAEAVDPYCSVGMCASSGCIDIPSSQIGDTAATDPDVLAVWKWDGERNWRTLPKFSTDLNAAFAAAEKTFLFGDGRRGLQFAVAKDDAPREWRMVERYTEFGYRHTTPICVASDSTPALAICAAILKLKEETE